MYRRFNLTEFYLAHGFTHKEISDREMEGEANGNVVHSISCMIFPRGGGGYSL